MMKYSGPCIDSIVPEDYYFPADSGYQLLNKILTPYSKNKLWLDIEDEK